MKRGNEIYTPKGRENAALAAGWLVSGRMEKRAVKNRHVVDVMPGARDGVDRGKNGRRGRACFLVTFAEFGAELSRVRTREGMAIARIKGTLRGKQPKLSDRQQRELCHMHATGEYSISDLAELFSVSRPTVYRALNRRHSH